jgi:polyketide biosynthesis 3-hydroxy-3-methylglutaryl-CoA synthase-like enzyme PksG
MNVGIEKMNFYGGMAMVDVCKLASYRKLDTARFDNLLIDEKSVALPFEDPVSYAINAALPLVNSLNKYNKN